MNATKCLEWCHEVRGNYPNDFCAALHVLDWLAAKAKTEAVTAEDLEAVEAARAWAKDLLG